MPVYRVSDGEGVWGDVSAESAESAREYLESEVYPDGSLELEYTLREIGEY